MNTECCKYNTLLLIGRIYIALMFVVAGAMKLLHFSDVVVVLSALAVPVPTLMAALLVVILLGGGLMILLGYMARLGALILFFFVFPLSYFYPDILGFSVAAGMHPMLINLAILGGLLYVMAVGGGGYSVCSHCKDNMVCKTDKKK